MLEAIFLGLFVLLGLVVFPKLWLHAIHNTREALGAELEYRAPTSDEAKHVHALDNQHSRMSALVAAGLERVGDLVLVIKATGRVQIVVRVFVDPPRTTCGYIAVAYGHGSIMFESYSSTQELVTSHARSDNYIEAGPTSKRQFVHASRPIAEAYREHLALAAEATVTMRTLDDVIVAMRNAHERLMVWRASQPAEALIDLDLRKMLGPLQYRLYGGWVRRRIQTLPRATIHRD